MFIPEVKSDGDILHFTSQNIYVKQHRVDLGIGNILKLEQHVTTVYAKGTKHNAIIVNVGYPDSVKILHEYSHEIPTWMKEDFNRFLDE